MGAVAKNNPLTGGIESDYEMNLETAKRIEADAQYQAVQRRRMADLLASEQVVAFANSGVTMEGTPESVIQQDRVDAELEAMNIIYSGKYQAAEMKNRARSQRQQAYLGLGMQAASMAVSGGAFKGAGFAARRSGLGASSQNGGAGYYGSSNTGESSSGNIA